MLLASNHFTPVIGVDIHATGVLPFNPVHPFIGMLMDPMDYIPFVGSSVNINGIPRGVTDTSGMLATKKHIPIATPPFVMMPLIANESIGFFGSANTYIEDRRVAPKGFMVMSCNDVGIPANLQMGPPKKPGRSFSVIPSLFAPTSMSLPIPTGPPVIVGGPYVPDLAGLLMNMAMGFAFGALLKGAVKVLKKVGGALLKAFNHVVCKKFKSTKKLGNWLCKHGFEPVDLVQGIVIYEGVDFELPGPIPFEWKRAWYSDSGYSGFLGYGCHSNFDLPLYVDYKEELIGLLLPDGRGVGFPLLKVDEDVFNQTEKLTLTRRAGWYELIDHNSRLTYIYRTGDHPDYRVHEIKHEFGFSIQLKYSGNRLSHIIDSCGRNLRMLHDGSGRITEIILQGNEEQKMVGYTYGEDGNMTGISDALDQVTEIEYDNHLMTKKTDRNGQAFYWEYDGKNTGSRCIHTWGTGGILEGWISYFPEKGCNIVTNSLGAQTTYYYTPDNIVTEIKDASGNSRFTDYTPDNEIYREIDEEGNMTGYTYDIRGNRTGLVLPDGSQHQFIYDKNDRLIIATDPEENSTLWTYDDIGRLESTIAPDGSITSFKYNEQNLISMITDVSGNETRLEYDAQFNLVSMLLPNGSKATWKYNFRGDVVQVENPGGATQSFQYDKLGRPIYIRQADFNTIRLQYNAYEEVIRAKDDQREVAFEYTPLGSLKMREEKGTRVFFQYDTEDQLRQIINEHGENYRFERNIAGQITREEGFDGITRFYRRDNAGKVFRVERPEGKWTEYEYNANGLMTRAEHNDGTWETFSYDKRGLLTDAVNQHTEVHLKRDSMGRVVEEKQGEHFVTSHFDKNGNRIKIKSSPGADIDLAYNEMGNVVGMAASCKSGLQNVENPDDKWQAWISHNALGQEIERGVTGGVKCRMWYDSAGRPVRQRVQSGESIHRHRSYSWNANDRLWQMINELTGGITSFNHDDFGNLASARYEDGSYDFKLPNEVGNLYKTRERTDRKYGRGGRLLENGNLRYEYDCEGNLLRKNGEGENWEYSWYSNGMLSKVVKSGNIAAEFEYDALGRRTAKIANNSITRFLWDGNVPLHEWKYDVDKRPRLEIDDTGELKYNMPEPVTDDLTTWVFDEGTFVPAAKISEDKRFSIITDYLGTPCLLYNEKGEKTWEAELDIYGKVRNLAGGSLADCPFRYQGQYEDVETGLYYNRFRYYSPDDGLYVSQDPIGLYGGDRFYSYVNDPNSWFDVIGLAIFPIITRGANNEMLEANANITKADLGTGTNTNASSRTYARSLGDQTDDAGHIIGKQLGGSGGTKNVFPQNVNLNRGQFAQFEGKVADLVHTKGSATITIKFEYGNGGTRPTNIIYNAQAPDGTAITKKFKNPCN